MEVGEEGGGAEDANGERGEESSASEEAGDESPLPPEKKENSNGKGDLELDECERKEEAGAEIVFAAKADEAGAVEEAKNEGERDLERRRRRRRARRRAVREG